MQELLVSIFIKPLTALLAAAGVGPDAMGTFLLIAVTLLLLIGATIYFVRHKRVTTPLDRSHTSVY